MSGAAVPFIGGIFKAGGALSQAQDRAWVLEDEAISAEKNAGLARQEGAYNLERHRIVSAKTMGGISADYGASGITADSGSVLDVLRESHTNSEMDRQNILFGAETKARNYEDHARAARQGAKNAKKMGQFNAFAALFMGGAEGASYDE